MVFPGEFRHHILPEKIHILNVSFTVDRLDKAFGGTAGNIAYNLSLLDEKPRIVATAGKDFREYAAWLKKNNLSDEGIKILDDEFTSQAFITTDKADNQIAAFHGGAMFRAHEQELENMIQKDDVVIIAANGKRAILEHARHCRDTGIRFIFDPGQAFPALDENELMECCKGSEVLIVNDYEWELWETKTGMNIKKTLTLTKQIIITLGAEGSKIISSDGEQMVPASEQISSVVDPTGCGDAYRAGILSALARDANILEGAQLGTILASFCIEKNGTQNHRPNMSEIKERYEANFGGSLDWL
jgi:adenosine kinase